MGLMGEVEADDALERVMERTLSEEEFADLTDEVATPAQVTFQTTDYPVDGLVKRLESRAMLVPQFALVSPDVHTAGFQRGFVWTKAQMDRFIESAMIASSRCASSRSRADGPRVRHS